MRRPYTRGVGAEADCRPAGDARVGEILARPANAVSAGSGVRRRVGAPGSTSGAVAGRAGGLFGISRQAGAPQQSRRARVAPSRSLASVAVTTVPVAVAEFMESADGCFPAPRCRRAATFAEEGRTQSAHLSPHHPCDRVSPTRSAMFPCRCASMPVDSAATSGALAAATAFVALPHFTCFRVMIPIIETTSRSTVQRLWPSG